MVKSIPLLRKDAICANMEIEYRTGKNGNNLLRENFSIELKTIIVNCKSLLGRLDIAIWLSKSRDVTSLFPGHYLSTETRELEIRVSGSSTLVKVST